MSVRVDPARYRPDDTPLLLRRSGPASTPASRDWTWRRSDLDTEPIEDLLRITGGRDACVSSLVPAGRGSARAARSIVTASSDWARPRRRRLQRAIASRWRRADRRTPLDGDVRNAARRIRRAAAGCERLAVHTAALVSIWQSGAGRDFDDVVMSAGCGMRHRRGTGRPESAVSSPHLDGCLATRTARSADDADRGYNDYQRTKVAADQSGREAVLGSGSPIVRVCLSRRNWFARDPPQRGQPGWGRLIARSNWTTAVAGARRSRA